MFVGYSHQDLPLPYLARGISAASDGPGRYALTSPTADRFWLNLGINPVHYPLRVPPLAPHGALGDCLAKWAETANLGSLGTEARIKGLVTSDKPLGLEDEDFLKQSLLDISTLRYFTRHAEDPRWLEWISELPEFNAIFVPGATLHDRPAELAFWFADRFAVPHFAVALDIVRRKNQTLSPTLWHVLAQRFHAYAAAGDTLRFWASILFETMPANGHSDFLAYMIDHCTMPADQQTILQLFRKLSAPKLRLKRRFFPPEDGKPAVSDAEIEPIARDYTTSRAYQGKVRPHLDVFAKGVAITVTATFEEANALLLMDGKAGPKWDPRLLEYSLLRRQHCWQTSHKIGIRNTSYPCSRRLQHRGVQSRTGTGSWFGDRGRNPCCRCSFLPIYVICLRLRLHRMNGPACSAAIWLASRSSEPSIPLMTVGSTNFLAGHNIVSGCIGSAASLKCCVKPMMQQKRPLGRGGSNVIYGSGLQRIPLL